MKFKAEIMDDNKFSEVAIGVRNLFPSNEHPNLALLRKEVAWVKEQAEDFDRWNKDLYWQQTDWGWADDAEIDSEGVMTCNTACCLAGNVAITDPEVTIILNEDHNIIGVRTKDGQVLSVEKFAADKLGLNYHYCDGELFDGDNEAKDIERVANRIAERVGETL